MASIGVGFAGEIIEAGPSLLTVNAGYIQIGGLFACPVSCAEAFSGFFSGMGGNFIRHERGVTPLLCHLMSQMLWM